MKKIFVIIMLCTTLQNITTHVENKPVRDYQQQEIPTLNTRQTLNTFHHEAQNALEDALHETHEDLEHAAKTTVRNAFVRPVLDTTYSLIGNLYKKTTDTITPPKPKKSSSYNIITLDDGSKDGFALPAPKKIKSN